MNQASYHGQWDFVAHALKASNYGRADVEGKPCCCAHISVNKSAMTAQHIKGGALRLSICTPLY